MSSGSGVIVAGSRAGGRTAALLKVKVPDWIKGFPGLAKKGLDDARMEVLLGRVEEQARKSSAAARVHPEEGRVPPLDVARVMDRTVIPTVRDRARKPPLSWPPASPLEKRALLALHALGTCAMRDLDQATVLAAFYTRLVYEILMRDVATDVPADGGVAEMTAVVDAWERLLPLSRWLQRTFHFLDLYHRDVASLVPLFPLALLVFRSQLWLPRASALESAFARLSAEERELDPFFTTEAIGTAGHHRQLLARFSKLALAMDALEADPRAVCDLDALERAVLDRREAPACEQFDRKFQTKVETMGRRYFVRVSREWSARALVEYARTAMRALQAEARRVQTYLCPGAEQRIIDELMRAIVADKCVQLITDPAHGLRPCLDRREWRSVYNSASVFLPTKSGRAPFFRVVREWISTESERLGGGTGGGGGGVVGGSKAAKIQAQDDFLAFLFTVRTVLETCMKGVMDATHFQTLRARLGAKPPPALGASFAATLATALDKAVKQAAKDPESARRKPPTGPGPAPLAASRSLVPDPHAETKEEAGGKEEEEETGLRGMGMGGVIWLEDGAKLAPQSPWDVIETVLWALPALPDLDAFLADTKLALARRLLRPSPAVDTEREVLAALKAALASPIPDMERMWSEVARPDPVAGDVARQLVREARGVAMSPLLLCVGSWPPGTLVAQVKWPAPLKGWVDAFARQYAASREGRKLTVTAGEGTLTLRRHALGKTRDWKDVQCMTLQGLCLLLFNDQPQWSPAEMATTLGVSVDLLLRVLHPLVFFRTRAMDTAILQLVDEPARPKPRDLKVTDRLCENPEYAFPKRRLAVPVVPLRRKEGQDRALDLERQHAVDAAVVRVMKTRRSLLTPDLVSQVTIQIARFAPTTRFIKTRIEALIDKEYLERDDDTANLLHYIA